MIKINRKKKQCVYVNFHYIFQNYSVLSSADFGG